ncbi:MAG: DUF2461 domain-containing protein [Acidimicrobiaceae bacterium]|nr:DUF2461 domain-containing protein [Acidimicrobiaceae bacterium]
MAFKGWPVEAVEFYEGLAADNTRTYWNDHKATYERCVKAPMEELLAELAERFGPGRVFRPYRDVRFSKDKARYKLNCAAHLASGYLMFSADGLFAGTGLYMPDPAQLQRYRAAVDDEKSGSELSSIVTTLRRDGYEVGAHEVLKSAPKGWAKDHRRIELLQQKGIVMSKAWPVGPWLGTRKAKDRVVAALEAGVPLNAWVERFVS